MPPFEAGVEASLRYLSSDEALRSLRADPYWPKWDSSWWHLFLLHEMGLANRIPPAAARAMVEALNRHYIREFPIDAGIAPKGTDAYLVVPCHCMLGCMAQVLFAAGIDVDRELPWVKEWLLRFQLPDGGLNCDAEAYRCAEKPSSIVGTISPLEAVLLCTHRGHTPEELAFLDRGAENLLARELRLGSTSVQNASEREDEADWLKPCFPRFYLYDVLRGLSFIAKWAKLRGRALPREKIAAVVRSLEARFPDGKIRLERHSYADVRTLAREADGEWRWPHDASRFPLLLEASALGRVSEELSEEWRRTKELLAGSR